MAKKCIAFLELSLFASAHLLNSLPEGEDMMT